MTDPVRHADAPIVRSDEPARRPSEWRLESLGVATPAEIADLDNSGQGDLAKRTALLLTDLLEWQRQPERRGTAWQLTIRNQRRGIARRLQETPSLKARLVERAWWAGVWGAAAARAAEETGLKDFPDACPWGAEAVLDQGWLPE